MTENQIKSAIESLLFIWGEALNINDMSNILGVNVNKIYECAKQLQYEYKINNRGIQINEINKSFQFCTSIENSKYIEKLCNPTKNKKLSQSALEVLAIIAYKQPITKVEIESIRGIRSDRTINNLLELKLIQQKGKLDKIGKPLLFGTTDKFLKQFGFTSLNDLPEINDIENIVKYENDKQLMLKIK